MKSTVKLAIAGAVALSMTAFAFNSGMSADAVNKEVATRISQGQSIGLIISDSDKAGVCSLALTSLISAGQDASSVVTAALTICSDTKAVFNSALTVANADTVIAAALKAKGDLGAVIDLAVKADIASAVIESAATKAGYTLDKINDAIIVAQVEIASETPTAAGPGNRTATSGPVSTGNPGFFSSTPVSTPSGGGGGGASPS